MEAAFLPDLLHPLAGLQQQPDRLLDPQAVEVIVEVAPHHLLEFAGEAGIAVAEQARQVADGDLFGICLLYTSLGPGLDHLKRRIKRADPARRLHPDPAAVGFGHYLDMVEGGRIGQLAGGGLRCV